MFGHFTGILQFFLIVSFLTGNAQPLKFNSLDIEDGLSQNSVLSITQDSKGFLWLGTRDGLNRYNSHQFVVYKHSASDSTTLSDNYITALLSDTRGRLWVGTRNGLNLYDGKRNSFERVKIKRPGAATGNLAISHLYEDRKGRIWVSCEGALFVIEGYEGSQKIKLIPLSARRIVFRCVFQDKKGWFWIGTSSGILKLLERNNKFVRIAPAVPPGLRNVQVNSFFEDQVYNLWIGTSGNGLFLFSASAGGFRNFLHQSRSKNSLINNYVRRLLADGKGRLLIGTQEGLSVLNLSTHEFENYVHSPWDKNSLNQNSIHSLFKDNAGNIWIGTFFGGLNSYFAYNTPFAVYSTRTPGISLTNNVISSIIEDEGVLWIGTEGGGINCINRSAGTRSSFTHDAGNPASLGSNLVKVIYKDKKGLIWVGTHGGGLNLFNRENRSFTRFLYQNRETVGSEITALLDDSKGNFWVGTEISGLHVYQKKGNSLLPLPNNRIAGLTKKISILALAETSDRKIWFGGPSGLYQITGNKVKKMSISGEAGLSAVNCIVEDGNRNVWIGTKNGGLILLNLQGKLLARYTVKEGLADNNVLGVIPYDKAEIWISTGKGLSRFDASHEIFYNYTEADGIAGRIFNNNSYYKSSKGEFFFGGYDGLTSFFPDQIEINTLQSPLYLTSLKIHNSEASSSKPEIRSTGDINSKGKITLSHDQNVFSVDFAILNFIKPAKNEYLYKLEGYDDEWKSTSTPSVTFTNVPPGAYTLLVRAKNNDSSWIERSLLGITVNPPFWKTWWAYIIYLLVLSGLVVFGLRHMLLKAMLDKNRELTQLKLNFFTNISHEIRTHLSLITGPAENLLKEGSADLKDQQQLITIRNNSESLLKLVNELMEFRKAETGHLQLHVQQWDLLPILKAAISSYYEAAVSKNIQVSLECDYSRMELYFDKDQLEKVIYNLLSNAFKFTPQNGFIRVSVQESNEQVEIAISNTGKGIAKENISKLFDNYFQEDDHGKSNTGYGIGLALSRSITEVHQGALTVSSEELGSDDKLTCFSLKLRKGYGHFDPSWIKNDPAPERYGQTISARQEFEQLAESSDNEGSASAGLTHSVLIVEDNAEIRKLIKGSLHNMFRIYESSNGMEAIDFVKQNLPDLIITDVMMPEMDGLELCRRIKSDESTSHIPVFMLTAKNTAENQVSGLQTGADIYISKPFSPRVLLLQVENFFKAREILWRRFGTKLRLDPGIPSEMLPESKEPKMHPLDEAFLNKITGFVNQNIGEPEFGVASLSAMAAMSQPVLFKKIKALTGLSANDFVKSLRMRRAAELLLENHYTVYEVSYMVGYDNSKYFSKEFKKQFNVSPSEYFGKVNQS
ncbi:hybrid sensor histidine kinase/response regulator transcription factor [Desertivirga xinjiangensis]|uniref:hybrid sensor histidine kinase/response regulator transcription factor n=1 Tax=Desertivirga xinjiangensis TaxID=539206 RepID=UPI002109BCFA|nr:two-component regulator propeller domain-containing protein [Pedobacter xinjiangensis]